MRRLSAFSLLLLTFVACNTSNPPPAGSSTAREAGASADTGSAPDSGSTALHAKSPLGDAFAMKNAAGGTVLVMSSIAGGCAARTQGKLLPKQLMVTIELKGAGPGTYPISISPEAGLGATLLLRQLGPGCAELDQMPASSGTVVLDRVGPEGVHGTIDIPPMQPFFRTGLRGEISAPACAAQADAQLTCAQ